jgi:hypothetical protein
VVEGFKRKLPNTKKEIIGIKKIITIINRKKHMLELTTINSQPITIKNPKQAITEEKKKGVNNLIVTIKVVRATVTTIVTILVNSRLRNNLVIGLMLLMRVID